ncbi:hypothetical protein HK103_000483 [Boothiomyces macroporosus]|uniref:Zn(2)-C6 fungal-type domain-containing protein n=1 Tax=Boothiomyces macroporosus TaxID=261099 RepID=A0AAD5Y1F4_9FUNG|nr:hypothetical protein HK103_000483 [Boothiomyces macroporosus]
MRRNNTCDNCIKKKRKCDRGRPKCSNCIASKLDCFYAETRQKPNAENQKYLEDRLHKLEALLAQSQGNSFGYMPDRTFFMTNNMNSKMEGEMFTNVVTKELSSQTKQFLFETKRDDLINLSFLSIQCPFVFLTADFLRKAAAKSPMVNFTLYSIGSTKASQEMVPNDVSNRIEMGSIYLDKAMSYFPAVIANPSLIGTLALFTIALSAIRNDRVKEGMTYFSLAVSMAKDIGMNVEEKLAALAEGDYERENYRGVWWSMYQLDRFLMEKNAHYIQDEDNQLFLPTTNKVNFDHAQDKLPMVGMQMLSSPEWFTPGLPNQSLEAYRILLFRIFGKVLLFNHLTQQKDVKMQPLYVMQAFSSSLREWWRSLPNHILAHFPLVQSNAIIVDPETTWVVLHTIVQFNHVKSLVYNPCMLKNIIENPSSAVSSHAFLESINICHENAVILQCFLRRNPNFDFCTATLGRYIFHIAVPLVCAFRMELPSLEAAKVAESLEVHVHCLREHTLAYEAEPILSETLDYLISLSDPIQVAKDYLNFKSSGKNPSVIKTLANPGSVNSPYYKNSSDRSDQSETQSPWISSKSEMPSEQFNSQPMNWNNNDMQTPMFGGAFMGGTQMEGIQAMQPNKQDSNYIDLLLSSDPFFHPN